MQSGTAVAAGHAGERDPAWRGRLAWLAIGLLALWPMLVLTEFRPWQMLDARSLRVTGRFLQGFARPAMDPEFLAVVARETWRTVAIATAGISLALLLAVPMAWVATAALSVSSLAGRMAAVPFVARQAARAAMVALRTVPELVWALVFVRVVGLGPGAGVLAIALLSLAIGRPFTLQYAREMVDSETAQSSGFMAANYVITWAWVLAFLLMILANALLIYVPGLPLWSGLAIAFAARNTAIYFSRWYPGYRKAKLVAPAAAPSRCS